MEGISIEVPRATVCVILILIGYFLGYFLARFHNKKEEEWTEEPK